MSRRCNPLASISHCQKNQAYISHAHRQPLPESKTGQPSSPPIYPMLMRISPWLWFRYRALDEEERELEEEEEDGERDILRDILGEAIEAAVPLIADWMFETIEAEGESLVFDTLKGMSSSEDGQ